ncbi:hypothetical protein MTBBW1_520010 [Desulfamplus magnetovallimortis]|uniref:Flagellar assembly protein H n=1 Tax=Desulfamplus magnetovallimortis TaxID=1246637 RepID=A0A1W1HHS9_9BACT|nr:hypothetical protein [Desulfamplus magnetovallimortis]SLM31983.1 hypothetical protein MTBBW1_520010 [Desulfamplus magnetovallimortis]
MKSETDKTDWHRLWGLMVAPLFERLGCEVTVEFDLSLFLECISQNRIYDFNILTPVRFIVTNDFDHPVLGLFSNKTEQIEKSTQRLKQDDWLLKKISSYLNALYNHYSLEGVHMPYTHEMFIKEHFPADLYEQFMLGKEKGLQKGLQEGRQEGELIGNITALQKVLKCQIATKEELRAKSIEELQAIVGELEKQIN